jgi:hypothetical protein
MPKFAANGVTEPEMEKTAKEGIMFGCKTLAKNFADKQGTVSIWETSFYSACNTGFYSST